VAHILTHAPEGGEVWLLTKDISDALDIPQASIPAILASRVESGVVQRKLKGERVRWQAGKGTMANEETMNGIVWRDAAPNAAPPLVPSPSGTLTLGGEPTTGDTAAVPLAPMGYAVQPVTPGLPSRIAQAAKMDDAVQRLMHRPFRCALFNNGTFTLQKGAADIELTADEALEAYELLSLLARKKGKQ
jgi:hypothetical protein